MGTVRVRMESIDWQKYLKIITSVQQPGQQTIRMQLDPLKKRLILEEDLGESCFRFFLPVRTLESLDGGQGCIYTSYKHQLIQAVEKLKKNRDGDTKLEFRTNTLTFQSIGRPVIIPVECQNLDEKDISLWETPKSTMLSYSGMAFVSCQWPVTVEFLNKLKGNHNPAIPFQVQNHSLQLLDETHEVFADTTFSGSFPRDPFLRFLQMLQLPSLMHLQVSENQWIRLRCIDFDTEFSVEAEIRLNKPMHVFFPTKKPELQAKKPESSPKLEIQSRSHVRNQNGDLSVFKLAIQKVARLLDDLNSHQMGIHVKGMEGHLELVSLKDSIAVRVLLPVSEMFMHTNKEGGWVDPKDGAALFQWIDSNLADNGVDQETGIAKRFEMTANALLVGDLTVHLFEPNENNQTLEYVRLQTQLENIYQMEGKIKEIAQGGCLQLLLGKVKDFTKHIGQVPGDMLHITSQDGMVNIAVDDQILRTRKMSKRLAEGHYVISMADVERVIDAFTDNQDGDATIRFTGVSEQSVWFTVNSRSGRYEIYVPSIQVPEMESQNGCETTETLTVEDLTDWVGLEELKQQIARIVSYAAFERQRQKIIAVKDTLPSLHMCFTGNPGTGKTMTARMLGQLLKQIGVLKKGHVVEVDRQKLIGQHIGHSEANLAKYVQQAIGGVLFIDEAHALYKQDSGKDFGHDIIHVLVKAME